MNPKLIMTFGAVAILLPIIALALLSIFTSAPKNLGAESGRLADCPSTPNCVSSQTDSEQHAIVPISVDDVDMALALLKQVLSSEHRCRVIEESEDYLRVEFTTALFRFVDDGEFLLDREAQVIHVRSASRAGASDLGLNRKRIEQIRNRLTAAVKNNE